MLFFYLLQVKHKDGVLLQQHIVLFLELIHFLGLIVCNSLDYFVNVFVLAFNYQFKLVIFC